MSFTAADVLTFGQPGFLHSWDYQSWQRHQCYGTGASRGISWMRSCSKDNDSHFSCISTYRESDGRRLKVVCRAKAKNPAAKLPGAQPRRFPTRRSPIKKNVPPVVEKPFVTPESSLHDEALPIKAGPDGHGNEEAQSFRADGPGVAPGDENAAPLAPSQLEASDSGDSSLTGPGEEPRAVEAVSTNGASAAQNQGIPGGSINILDLMAMISDAEQNIMTLNRLRSRALEELEEARASQVALQRQTRVLEGQLAEAATQTRVLGQEQVKNKLLEAELQALRQRSIREREASSAVELAGLRSEVAALKERVTEGELRDRQLAELQAELEDLKGQLAAAQEVPAEDTVSAAELGEALKRNAELVEEKNRLQGQLAEVERLAVEREARLGEAEKRMEALEAARANDVAALEEAMATQVAQKEEENKVIELQRQLLEREVAEAQEQLEGLRSQVAAAEQKMVEVQHQLAESNKQLGLLQEEVATAEVLRSENESLANQVATMLGRLEEVENGSFQTLEGLKKEMQEVEEENEVLRARVLAAEVQMGSLEDVVQRGAQLERQVAELQVLFDEEAVAERAVQEAERQVAAMSAELAEVEVERANWRAVASEKDVLQEQVVLLRQQLAEVEDALQAELRSHKEEAEEFHQILESLGSNANLPAGSPATSNLALGTSAVRQVAEPAKEQAWELWSQLMQTIDSLLLSGHLEAAVAHEVRLLTWQRSPRLRDAFEAALAGGLEGADLAGVLAGTIVKPKLRPGLHIVHISAEMAPVAKVGGLGDVITGLGKALQRMGHLVEIIIPKYDCMDYSRIQGLQVLDYELSSFFDNQMHKSRVWRGVVEGLPVYFIEPLHPGRFFWRGSFYGESDDFRRFTYFCRAALEFLLQAQKQPDIIHCHDWHTAVVAPLYWDIYYNLGLNSARVAFTCHNFEYQGVDPPASLEACGLSVTEHYRQDRMQDNFMLDRINLLKGGLVYSNLITTVSPTYAQEVRGPEGGKGLHVTLGQQQKKFFGVLNGIDNEAWDPATDSLLAYPYSAADLAGKLDNKETLCRQLGLLQGSSDGLTRPLVGCVTRLVPQKGVHLIRAAIFHTLEQGGLFILLGSSPVPEIQREFEGIAQQFADHPQVRLILKYDEELSHLIYAASDLIIIPSIFEPCGLTQLIAMRYGAIPVVRKTGGLADSVFDMDDQSISIERRNGFSFSSIDEEGLKFALDRAFAYYLERPQWWQGLVGHVMSMDFGWGPSADLYVQLYNETIAEAFV